MTTMAGGDNERDLTALSNVMHEFAAARSEIRRLSDEINRAIGRTGGRADLEKLRAFAPRLVDRLDFLDILFEFLRIELNPSGIEYAPRCQSNIHGIFYRALRHYSARMQQKRLKGHLDQDKGFVIEAYPSLGILPMVLIDNAIKYAPIGSAITVSLDQEHRKAIVESLGPKIEDVECCAIFERGFRGRNARLAQHGGQGLGLYIARRICDAQGFAIVVSQHGNFFVGQVPYTTVSFLLDFCGQEKA